MTHDSFARYPTEPVVRLRPMTNGEILDLSLRVYRANGLRFLRLTAAPSLFCLAVWAFFSQFVWPALQRTNSPDSMASQVGETATLLLLFVAVGGPLFIIGLTTASLAVVRHASATLVGDRIDEQVGMTDLLPRLFGMVLREFVVGLGGLAVGVGMTFGGALLASVTNEGEAFSGLITLVGVLTTCAGIVVFLFVIATHALVVPIAVLERTTGSAAVRRSRMLMKASRHHPSGTGAMWGLYGLVAFVALIIFFGSLIVVGTGGIRDAIETATSGSTLQAILLPLIDLTPAWVMLWTLIPVWACTTTVVYYERRIRMEGFDIDALAARL